MYAVFLSIVFQFRSMSDISESELEQLKDRLPPIIENFEHFTHIGSGTFSKVYMANIKVQFWSRLKFYLIILETTE